VTANIGHRNYNNILSTFNMAWFCAAQEHTRGDDENNYNGDNILLQSALNNISGMEDMSIVNAISL